MNINEVILKIVFKINFMARLRCAMNKFMFKKESVGSICGFTVASFGLEGEVFFQQIQKSIKLIQKNDPKRFLRILSNVDYVVDDALIAGAMSASYLFRERAIRIDFDPAFHDLESMLDVYCAGILVHEATHGFLYSKVGIKSWQQWERCEIICLKEENRFYRKLEMLGFPIRLSSLIRDVDVQHHRRFRKLSYITRMKILLNRSSDKMQGKEAGDNS